MSRVVLLQLVSQQTMPNLLPILRLQPTHLVHFVTPRTASFSQQVLAAAHAAGLHPHLETIILSSMPGISECFQAVQRSLHSRPAATTAVINFTGGTKLMSIGAYAAARVLNVPSLYVDTQDACFTDGDTSPELGQLLGQDWSFTPIMKKLRVDVLGIVHGVARITGGRDWMPCLPLARHLGDHPDEEEKVHQACFAPGGPFPEGREPRSPAEWLASLDRPLVLPPATAQRAVESGLFRPGTSSGEVLLAESNRAELDHLTRHYVEDFPQRYQRAVAPLQQATSLLTGGWWEVLVADAVRNCGLFRDVRWSALVGDRDGPDTEEDILGMDGVELLYISCKRGGARARLLPHLEEMRARAATIGGAFHRKFLALHYPPTGRVARNLQTQASRLDIRIITPRDLRKPHAFAR